MHILERSIRTANSAGRTALIPFITAGFPTIARFWTCMEALDTSGADVIEIGVPFSDPVADGPVVAEASARALAQHISLTWIINQLRSRKQQGQAFRTPLVLMSYYNPLLHYGLAQLAADLQEAGVHGCIVPDLPLEETHPLRTELHARDIALIPLVASNTSLERMQAYAAVSQAYVYTVSVMGTTGTRQTLPTQVADTIRRARQAFSLPIALGFGLREPAQLAALSPESRPDAAIFGSALLQHIDAGNCPSTFLEHWQ